MSDSDWVAAGRTTLVRLLERAAEVGGRLGGSVAAGEELVDVKQVEGLVKLLEVVGEIVAGGEVLERQKKIPASVLPAGLFSGLELAA